MGPSPPATGAGPGENPSPLAEVRSGNNSQSVTSLGLGQHTSQATGAFEKLKLTINTLEEATSRDPVLVVVIFDQVNQKGATGEEDLPSRMVERSDDSSIPHIAATASGGNAPGAGTAHDSPRPGDEPDNVVDEEEKPIHSRVSVEFDLDGNLKGNTTLEKVDYPSTINVQFKGSDGISRLVVNKDIFSDDGEGIEIILDRSQVQRILAKIDLPPARPQTIVRTAQFTEIVIGSRQAPLDFTGAKLLTAPLSLTKKAWDDLGYGKLFKPPLDEPTSSSCILTQTLPGAISSLPWTSTRVAVDGAFSARFIVYGSTKKPNAWAWLLTGNRPYGMLGVIMDTMSKETDSQARAIILPAPAKEAHDAEGGKGLSESAVSLSPDTCHCDQNPTRVPVLVSETELANNPGVYTEDPGSFCQPFRNPERIISEKSFFSVLRVEQPEISAQASSLIKRPILVSQQDVIVRDRVAMHATEGHLAVLAPIFHPPPWLDAIKGLESDRHMVDSQHPIQWEGDSLRYQATTVAKGHILEFRLRTRSNGYSLGGVAKTLTLAPRQTKRIQKIEWSRSERAARLEGTQLADSTSDSMAHDTSYQDAVSASLNEWAQGSSTSSVTAAAAGGGMALGPVVIGGGVAHSSSQSTSQQSGGRDTTAAEESQWRDAVRRHGDALRKFESTVVQEVTEMEAVTGTTEVIRNINYGHSLTVIYHNILRHLRVDTEFAGARECLFVPFAIRPFSMDRALRWKDTLSGALRNRSFSRALTYLKDVVTNFSNSSIPPGRRSDHPVKSLWGSLYIDLAISRPADKDDGKFDIAQWVTLLPFLPSPALAIYQQLIALDAMIRDQVFQQRFAPAIATKWCDSLQISDGSQLLNADFTLATAYRFNGTVRIDFQVDTNDSITRETLSSLNVLALKPLPPGSKANLKSLSYYYETDFEKGSASLNRGVNDLITSETGQVDSLGAKYKSVPSAYERQDLRQELRLAVADLLDHLNEYVEYYHKAIWWNMDRDRIFMLLDGFIVPRLGDPVSIANVVERDPIGVAGNCLVFRVSAGVFLGLQNLQLSNPEELHDYYNANESISEPMHISLPTDGLYAKTILDDCIALEEHRGNQDWALADPDPELGALDASLLQSRKSEPSGNAPTTLPSTIINLSNATPAPAPQGLTGAFGAVQNANAFRDMAGLSGTQQLATAGLQAAASLATSFGGSAAGLEMARITGKQQAVTDADQKLASIQRAKDKKLVTPEQAVEHANKVLNDVTTNEPAKAPHENADVKPLIHNFTNDDSGQPKTFEATNSEGAVKLTFGTADPNFIAASATTAASTRRPDWTTFSSLYWTYDRKASKDVRDYINIGWSNNPNYQNTCTMRLSQALNDYGTPILNSANSIPGVVTEHSPQNNQRYLVRVTSGRAYLLSKWGSPDVNLFKKPGGIFDAPSDPRFKDKHGVIVFQISFRDASGHIDLWDGKHFSHELPGGWEPPATDPNAYWKMATNIMLWYLTDPKGTHAANGETGINLTETVAAADDAPGSTGDGDNTNESDKAV